MSRFRWMLIVVVLTNFLVAACSREPATGEGATADPELTACTDPRSQVCTAQYDPVCGYLGGDNPKTFSNACMACADAGVSGHRPGACE